MNRYAPLCIAALLSLIVAAPAHAQPLPASLNLGFTSFMDGIAPAGPGFYYQQYLHYISANNVKDADGNNLALPTAPDFDILISLNQFIYEHDEPLIFNARPGIDVLVPIVFADVDPDSLGFTTDDGIGDLVIGPYLQWDPVMGENGPKFVHRIELDFLLPTGEYDNATSINPGDNVFAISPYWAGTYWITPRWTASWRAHYIWIDKNDDPNFAHPDYPLPTDSTQPGQAIHVNFASSVELIPNKLRAGVNGYWLEQLTDSQIDGADSGWREQVIAVGPGAMWSFSKENHVFVNAYWETEVEQRSQAFRLNFRWTHHFH